MLALTLLSTGVSSVAYAAGGSARSSSSQGQTKVQRDLANIKTENAKINTNADYFIYYFSASWCGPCQKLMPSTVSEYTAMKRSKRVELILVSGDKTQEAAMAYVKKHKAKFPVVMASSEAAKSLPSCKSAGYIPSACIIDKNGKVIQSGHGSIVKDWKKYCSAPVSKSSASGQGDGREETPNKPDSNKDPKDDNLMDKVLDFSVRQLFE